MEALAMVVSVLVVVVTVVVAMVVVVVAAAAVVVVIVVVVVAVVAVTAAVVVVAVVAVVVAVAATVVAIAAAVVVVVVVVVVVAAEVTELGSLGVGGSVRRSAGANSAGMRSWWRRVLVTCRVRSVPWWSVFVLKRGVCWRLWTGCVRMGVVGCVNWPKLRRHGRDRCARLEWMPHITRGLRRRGARGRQRGRSEGKGRTRRNGRGSGGVKAAVLEPFRTRATDP